MTAPTPPPLTLGELGALRAFALTTRAAGGPRLAARLTDLIDALPDDADRPAGATTEGENPHDCRVDCSGA